MIELGRTLTPKYKHIGLTRGEHANSRQKAPDHLETAEH